MLEFELHQQTTQQLKYLEHFLSNKNLWGKRSNK
jgi:hypothetical protein